MTISPARQEWKECDRRSFVPILKEMTDAKLQGVLEQLKSLGNIARTLGKFGGDLSKRLRDHEADSALQRVSYHSFHKRPPSVGGKV
jgi:hypothetical protein